MICMGFRSRKRRKGWGGTRLRTGNKTRLSILLIPGDGSGVVHRKTNYFSNSGREISVKYLHVFQCN